MKLKRKKPMNLVLLDKLKCRKALSADYDRYHKDLLRGFKHECKIDWIIEEIEASWIVIPGFTYYELFKKNFQLDLLLVTGNEIFVSEIKGYRYDIYFDEDGVIYNSNHTKIDDPLEQVKLEMLCGGGALLRQRSFRGYWTSWGLS